MKRPSQRIDAVRQYCGISGKGSDAICLGVAGQESYVTTWTTSADVRGRNDVARACHFLVRKLYADSRVNACKRYSTIQISRVGPHSLIKDRQTNIAIDNAVVVIVLCNTLVDTVTTGVYKKSLNLMDRRCCARLFARKYGCKLLWFFNSLHFLLHRNINKKVFFYEQVYYKRCLILRLHTWVLLTPLT